MSSHSRTGAIPLATRRRFLSLAAPSLASLALATACTYADIVVPGPDAAGYDLLYEETDPVLNRSRLTVRSLQTGATSGVFGIAVTGAMPSASLDGGRVVYVGFTESSSSYDYQDLWTLTRGGTPQRLTLGEGPENSPSLSPDGQRIVYVKLDESGKGTLYVAQADGRNERRVMPAISYAPDIRFAYPSWSPDGTRLLFSAGEPGRLHLWTSKADGSGLQQLTAATISDIDGAWSPDGQVVAFTRTASPASAQLVLKHLRTGEERTFAFPFRNRFPAWSPDGQRLAFVSNMDDNLDLELYTVRADGQGLVRHTYDDFRQQSPRWLRR